MEFEKININVFEDNKSTIKSDIQIISEDNALYYKKRDDDYTNQFNLTPIESGITFQDGQYYYFNHNIIETRTSWGRKDNTNFSYDIYFIDEWLKDKIVSGKSNGWEPFFYSHFKYGRKIIATGTQHKNSTYSSFQEKVSKLDGNYLYIPYENIPSDLVNRDKKMKREITIGEFLNNHNKEYKNYIQLDENREVIRDFMLSFILK